MNKKERKLLYELKEALIIPKFKNPCDGVATTKYRIDLETVNNFIYKILNAWINCEIDPKDEWVKEEFEEQLQELKNWLKERKSEQWN